MKARLSHDPRRHHIDVPTLTALRNEGLTNAAIGAIVGFSEKVVSKRAIEAGLPPRVLNIGRRTGQNIEALYCDYSLEQIGTMLGISHTSVARALRRRGVKLRRAVRRHKDLVSECVRLRRAGWLMHDIGRQLGLTPCQVATRVHRVLGKGAHGGPRPGAGGWQRKRKEPQQ
jgi:predicted transcriptional regulator